ncbi:MAG: LuxR C-terminal-related transcriptional regulator [Pseudomonadota bacterium]
MEKDGYAALGRIYEAAVDPGRWRHALDAVAELGNARTAALFIRNPDPKARPLFLMDSRLLAFSRTFWGMYYGVRLHHLQDADWDRVRPEPRHKLLEDHQISGGLDLDGRADFRLLQRRLKVRRRLVGRLKDDQAWFDALELSYHVDLDAVPDGAAAQLAPLLPHLTKAAEIGRTFRRLKILYKAVLSVLDRVQIGMAIAVPAGEVVVQNALAREIFERGDGLSLGPDDRLRARNPDVTAALQAAIARAAATMRGEDDAPDAPMVIERASGAMPYLIDVTPLRDAKGELDPELEGALITIIDPERVPQMRIDRFVALYGLTQAEADVCRLILQGLSVADIAEQRGTTPVTAKNQVAAILAKTGVSRRAELCRLVVRVLPPVG